MLTEFGGIAYSPDVQAPGATRVPTARLNSRSGIPNSEGGSQSALLAGFCYTQFTDTYQEANGLLYADRTPKFPIEDIALATRGSRSARDRQVEWAWRERIMNFQRHQYLVPAEDYRTQDRH